MFNKTEFKIFLASEFSLDGTAHMLISNCIDFVELHHKEDFTNKLYELLESCFGLEIHEIEKFYEEV